MYQFDWADIRLWSGEKPIVPDEAPKIAENLEGAMLLEWEEHCVECALPLCYKVCPLYVERRDRKCARLAYGIVRNKSFSGLLPCGADVRYRRWGKLEAVLTGRFVSVGTARLLNRLDQWITAVVSGASALLSPVNRKRRLNGALTKFRGELLGRIGRKCAAFDCFLVECFAMEHTPCNLIVELSKAGRPEFRQSLPLQLGRNRFELKIPLPASINKRDEYTLMVYPDGDRELRVIFTYLDFVAFKKAPQTQEAAPATLAAGKSGQPPQAKLKCVAWDLDNTAWKGILVEDGPEKIELRPEAVELMRWLDERGILQTIASKNHHDEAIAVLERFGLAEYFLYPAINWGPKSVNLQQIADKLNINIDSFALIDDSPFERAEVGEALSMVRVYDETNLLELKDRPEFDVPITETSRTRRKSYMTEILREHAREVAGSDNTAFLRSCGVVLRLFQPGSPEEIARCLELIQRSNQLNLSSRRYNPDEFQALLADANVYAVALECSDRFGAYGVVGFASIEIGGDEPVAKDFVLSCRVAQKHVEHAFYTWLGQQMYKRGARRLLVDLVKTERNKPLVKVFEELPFTRMNSDGNRELLGLELNPDVKPDDILSIDDQTIGLGNLK